MATVPLSGTNVRLLSGVPFSNDYKHTRYFETKDAQTNYFLSKPVVYQNSTMSFQRIEGEKGHYISVGKSIDELWGTNYIMFQNTQYNSKWFYAFVTKLEYKQKGLTYVHFQIDTLQTWFFEGTFKPSYVVREHTNRWNSDGSPVINTIDEGLNYGTEYETVSLDRWTPYGNVFFLVMVAKKTLHLETNTQQSMMNGVPTPLQYYVHPFTFDDQWLQADNTPLAMITDVLNGLYLSEDATNNIVSLYITDYIGYPIPYESFNFTLDPNYFEVVKVGNEFNTIHVKNIVDYQPMEKDFGDKYSNFTKSNESKLLMYPYTVTILDDFKGNRTELKNEYIASSNLSLTARGSMGTDNKVSYSVKNYNNGGLSSDNQLLSSLEHSLINNSPNDVPILSDYLSAYFQGNRNTLENQKSSILFNGVMSGIGNAIGGVGSGLQGNAMGTAGAINNIWQGAGNTVLAIQGMEAKIKDISNLPPQLVKMGSNTAFDYGNGYNGVYIIKKQIKPEYRKKLEDFFNMYGYKMNEVKIPNFHTRKFWNYVQTLSCVIIGNINNEDLQEIKNIFDNGITFWHTDDIGNYSLDNEEVSQ